MACYKFGYGGCCGCGERFRQCQSGARGEGLAYQTFAQCRRNGVKICSILAHKTLNHPGQDYQFLRHERNQILWTSCEYDSALFAHLSGFNWERAWCAQFPYLMMALSPHSDHGEIYKWMRRRGKEERGKGCRLFQPTKVCSSHPAEYAKCWGMWARSRSTMVRRKSAVLLHQPQLKTISSICPAQISDVIFYPLPPNFVDTGLRSTPCARAFLMQICGACDTNGIFL